MPGMVAPLLPPPERFSSPPPPPPRQFLSSCVEPALAACSSQCGIKAQSPSKPLPQYFAAFFIGSVVQCALMSAPDLPDTLASISKSITSAAAAAYSFGADSSSAFYNRCALFVVTAFSPSGRETIASSTVEVCKAIADDPAKFTLAWGAGASVFAAGLAATPRAALLFRLRNADRIRALIFGCAAVTASGAAATASSMCIMKQPANFTSAVRDAASPQRSSGVTFSWIWPALPAAEVALLCGALSLLTFRACGGRARYLLPSGLGVRALLLRASCCI